jgi:predicted transcriptional regulator
MAWYDDPVTVTAVAVVIIFACGVVIYTMRRLGTKGPPKKQPQKTQSTAGDLGLDYETSPFKISKSVQASTATTAKDELRMLDLERDILSDAIRRLYEAQAEGKITEQEREKLAGTYTARMMAIKESISKDESIVALHDLESMQEDLMKLFSERFGELTSKVEELRTRIDVKPIREIPVKMPTLTPASQMEKSEETEEEEEEGAASEEKQKRKRKPPEEKPDAKTEAEKRIETIRSEVEKVLDKLGQMEIES